MSSGAPTDPHTPKDDIALDTAALPGSDSSTSTISATVNITGSGTPSPTVSLGAGTPESGSQDRPNTPTPVDSTNITTIPDELQMTDVKSYIALACGLTKYIGSTTRLFDLGMIRFAEGDYTPFTFNAEQPLAKQYLDWIRANKEHAIRLLNNKEQGSIYWQISEKLPALAKTILAENSELTEALRAKYSGTDDAIATAITEAFSTAWDEKIKDKMANTIVSHIIMHVANQKYDTEGDTEFRPYFPMEILSKLAQKCRQSMEIRTDHEIYAKEILEYSMLLADHTFTITNLLSLDDFCAQKIKNPAFYGEPGLSESQNLDDFLNYLLDQHPEHSWWGESDRINTLDGYLQYCHGNATVTTDIDGVIAQVLYKAPVGHPVRDVLLSAMFTSIDAFLPPQYATLLKEKKLEETYLGMLAAFYKARGRELSNTGADFSKHANTIAKQCIALHDALPFLASFEFPNPITDATLKDPEFEANISILYYHMLRYSRAGFPGADESIPVIAAFLSHCDPVIFNLVKENMAKVFSYFDQNEAAQPHFKFFPQLIMRRSYDPDHMTCSNEQDIQDLNHKSQVTAMLINEALKTPHPRATAASAAQNAAPVLPTEFQTRMEQSKSLVKSYKTSEPTRAKVRARILPPKTPSALTNFGYGVAGAFTGIGVLAAAAAFVVAAPVVLVAVAAVAITSFVAAAATWFITSMRDPTNKPAKSRLTPKDEKLIKELEDGPEDLPNAFSTIEELRLQLIQLNSSIQHQALSAKCQAMFEAAYEGKSLTTAPESSLTKGYMDRLIRLKSEGDPCSKVTQLRGLENDVRSQFKTLQRACHMSKLCLDLKQILDTLTSTRCTDAGQLQLICGSFQDLTLGATDIALPALTSFLSHYSSSDRETVANQIQLIIQHAKDTSNQCLESIAVAFESALKHIQAQDNPSSAPAPAITTQNPHAAHDTGNAGIMSTGTTFRDTMTPSGSAAGTGLFF